MAVAAHAVDVGGLVVVLQTASVAIAAVVRAAAAPLLELFGLDRLSALSLGLSILNQRFLALLGTGESVSVVVVATEVIEAVRVSSEVVETVRVSPEVVVAVEGAIVAVRVIVQVRVEVLCFTLDEGPAEAVAIAVGIAVDVHVRVTAETAGAEATEATAVATEATAVTTETTKVAEATKAVAETARVDVLVIVDVLVDVLVLAEVTLAQVERRATRNIDEIVGSDCGGRKGVGADAVVGEGLEATSANEIAGANMVGEGLKAAIGALEGAGGKVEVGFVPSDGRSAHRRDGAEEGRESGELDEYHLGNVSNVIVWKYEKGRNIL